MTLLLVGAAVTPIGPVLPALSLTGARVRRYREPASRPDGRGRRQQRACPAAGHVPGPAVRLQAGRGQAGMGRVLTGIASAGAVHAVDVQGRTWLAAMRQAASLTVGASVLAHGVTGMPLTWMFGCWERPGFHRAALAPARPRSQHRTALHDLARPPMLCRVARISARLVRRTSC